MKKIIFILLLLPLVILSQEEKFDRTITFSQFAKELKEASEKGTDYTLENCYIIYDTIRDEKHILKPNSHDIFGFKQTQAFVGDMVIKNLTFNDTSKIKITNCRFGKSTDKWSTTLTFKNCFLGDLAMTYNDVTGIYIHDSKIKNFRYIKKRSNDDLVYKDELVLKRKMINASQYNNRVEIKRSKLESISCTSDFEKRNEEDNNSSFRLDSSNCSSVYISRFTDIYVIRNELTSLTIGNSNHETKYCEIASNVMKLQKPQVKKLYVNLNPKKISAVLSEPNFYITSNLEKLVLKANKYIESHLSNDSILNLLVKYQENYDPIFTISRRKSANTDISFAATGFLDFKVSHGYIDIKTGTDSNLILSNGEIYTDSTSFDLKLKYLKKIIEENKIDISRYEKGGVEISSKEIKHLKIDKNDISFLEITQTNFLESFNFNRTFIDSAIILSKVEMPNFNRVNFDTTLINKVGFKYYNQTTKRWNYSHGIDKADKLDSITMIQYESNLNQLIATHKLLIQILNKKGDELKTKLIIQLKDIQTNKKALLYYKKQNLENWFNWQGSEFLRWYSDYGVNPFKALRYCFLTMLYFAMFYFIFYNEWDKIDRGFLIKRFNSVMDYFTTEKRIEDFYSSTHDEEMTTFTDFKNTLDKNKVYMPSMLGVLAKPIYQISLLRYKLLNFSYKKAEFMAGRKWVDLEKKERYWIGGLTFILTVTYIIYLIFIRAINSIVLSINAFSTLGFGQIPVRGFTKYVAIIEGFVGWFFLSIFLVSILNQMMNV